jgi:hypothetical protein
MRRKALDDWPLDVKPILPKDFPRWEPKVGDWIKVGPENGSYIEDGMLASHPGDLGIACEVGDGFVCLDIPGKRKWGYYSREVTPIPDLAAYLQANPDCPNFKDVIQYLMEAHK